MNITVIKRSGKREPLTLEKWQAQIAKICSGIADVSQSMIKSKHSLISTMVYQLEKLMK